MKRNPQDFNHKLNQAIKLRDTEVVVKLTQEYLYAQPSAYQSGMALIRLAAYHQTILNDKRQAEAYYKEAVQFKSSRVISLAKMQLAILYDMQHKEWDSRSKAKQIFIEVANKQHIAPMPMWQEASYG